MLDNKILNIDSEHSLISQELNNDFKQLKYQNKLNDNFLNKAFKLELLLITNKHQVSNLIAKDISLSGSFTENLIPFEFKDSDFLVVIQNKKSKNPEFQKFKIQFNF